MTFFKQPLKTLFKNQRFAVLSTQGHGRPYASMIGFGFSPDYGSKIGRAHV